VKKANGNGVEDRERSKRKGNRHGLANAMGLKTNKSHAPTHKENFPFYMKNKYKHTRRHFHQPHHHSHQRISSHVCMCIAL